MEFIAIVILGLFFSLAAGFLDAAQETRAKNRRR